MFNMFCLSRLVWILMSARQTGRDNYRQLINNQQTQSKGFK